MKLLFWVAVALAFYVGYRYRQRRELREASRPQVEPRRVKVDYTIETVGADRSDDEPPAPPAA